MMSITVAVRIAENMLVWWMTSKNQPKTTQLNYMREGIRVLPDTKNLFPLSWHGERAYSKSKAPSEIGNQTNHLN